MNCYQSNVIEYWIQAYILKAFIDYSPIFWKSFARLFSFLIVDQWPVCLNIDRIEPLTRTYSIVMNIYRYKYVFEEWKKTNETSFMFVVILE